MAPLQRRPGSGRMMSAVAVSPTAVPAPIAAGSGSAQTVGQDATSAPVHDARDHRDGSGDESTTWNGDAKRGSADRGIAPGPLRDEPRQAIGAGDRCGFRMTTSSTATSRTAATSWLAAGR